MSGRKDAWEEDDCLMCKASPGGSVGEAHAVVSVVDHATVPLGEDDHDHLVPVPVCAPHYRAFQQYKSGLNIEEVDVL